MPPSAASRVLWASCVLALGLLAWPRLAVGEPAPAASGPLLRPGASCGFIAPCTRIGEIGLHIAALSSLRTDKDRSFVDVQGQARLSITFLDLAEIGTMFAGHIGSNNTGSFFAISSPATLYARLRLLPLPFFRPLSGGFLRLALHAQHDFVDANFGEHEPPGIARTTLHVIAGKSYGPIDIDGSVGFVLTPRSDHPPQQAAFQLSLAASYWFARPETEQPRDQLRLQLEALYQFAQDPRFSTQGTLLAGLLGMTKNGFGGSFAVGPEFIDSYAGVRVMGGLQFSWGPHVRNPWAERKAAEPKETPAWIWTLLGAIDPILREDGCVWTDPTPRQPSYKWFCIGKPDPQDPSMILLDSGGRLPVGTHLWEHGTSLRINDGTKVAEIPLTARMHKAVLDYVDGLLRHDPDPKLCEGKIDPIPQGLDAGWASVVANDDFGGRAAVLGMQIYREITCNPEAQSSMQILSLLGKVGGRGPLRAKPNVNEDRFAQSQGKPRNGGGGKDSAEHVHAGQPPRRSGPLSPQVRDHILYGERDPHGRSRGWHHEASGDRSKGTFVVEETRSSPDAHGVYEANVLIEGAKKGARSSFFPRHWSAKDVIEAVEEACEHRQPVAGKSASYYNYRHRSGVLIELRARPDGSIYTAYPIRE